MKKTHLDISSMTTAERNLALSPRPRYARPTLEVGAVVVIWAVALAYLNSHHPGIEVLIVTGPMSLLAGYITGALLSFWVSENRRRNSRLRVSRSAIRAELAGL